MTSIAELAQNWLDLDQDPATREEIASLVSAHNDAELEKRLRTPIAFGTAGLRSAMKAGFAHMNALTVLQATQGLAQYIINNTNSSDKNTNLSVVIGHDARRNSAKFAKLAAGIFLHFGFKVYWFGGKLVHTPLVPFAVNQYRASAGVMVTASHNPKDDNGYKVYWANGCQIIPPHDTGIAAEIAKVQKPAVWDESAVDATSAHVENAFLQSRQGYLKRLRQLVATSMDASHETLPFTYTAMHGVGLPFMEAAASILGYDKSTMHIVSEQAQPDPAFSTVPFPNPEEKGALDLAIQTAERSGTTVIVANDPDADRFAAAEKLENGKWHQFTGNQMGALLASHVLETYHGDKSKLAMLASTVSSRMLAVMAEKEGFYFRETLTGFKWLGNVAMDLKTQGYDPSYAYEEAIGYMFPSIVWDKDGVSAATVFLNMRQRAHAQGLTVWQKLQSLYERYGYFEDANTYLISPSPAVTNQIFETIRSVTKPKAVGSRQIKRWRDLTVGFDTADVLGDGSNTPDLPVDASAQMITCDLADNVRFTARGSGTEPKIKLYIEARAENSAEAKQIAEEVLQDLLGEWFKPEENGLRLAGA